MGLSCPAGLRSRAFHGMGFYIRETSLLWDTQGQRMGTWARVQDWVGGLLCQIYTSLYGMGDSVGPMGNRNAAEWDLRCPMGGCFVRIMGGGSYSEDFSVEPEVPR